MARLRKTLVFGMTLLALTCGSIFSEGDLTSVEDEGESDEDIIASLLLHLLDTEAFGCTVRFYHDYPVLPQSFQNLLSQMHLDSNPFILYYILDLPDMENRQPNPTQVGNYLPQWNCPKEITFSTPSPPLPMGGPCVLHAIFSSGIHAQRATNKIMARRGEGVQLDRDFFLFWNREGRNESLTTMEEAPLITFHLQVVVAKDSSDQPQIRFFTSDCNEKLLINFYNISADVFLPKEGNDTKMVLEKKLFFAPHCQFNGATLHILVLVPFGGISGKIRLNISSTHPFYTPPKVVQEVSSVLNFKANMTFGGLHHYHRTYKNGTCEGYAGHLYLGDRDVIFHVGLPQILGTFDSVLLTTPYFHDHYTFYILKPRVVFPWNSFMQPLQKEVWIGLLLVYLFACLMYWVVRTMVMGKRQDVAKCFQSVFSILVEQSWKTPSPSLVRVFLAAFFVSFVVVVWGYKGKLVAYLTLPRREWIPTNFEELANSDYHWVFFGKIFKDGLAGYAALPEVKTFRALLPKLNTHFLLEDSDELCLFSCLSSPKNACIGTRFFMDQMVQKRFSDTKGHSLLAHSEDQLFRFGYAAVTTREWPYMDILKGAVSRLFEIGVIPFWYTKMKRDTWFASRRLNMTKAVNVSDTESESEANRPIKWSMVEGVFGLLFAGYVLSAIIWVAELIYHWREKKKRRKILQNVERKDFYLIFNR